MKRKYKDKFDKMANAPIKGLIIKLAIPTTISMLITSVYNMADSFFVGKIDTSATASIGIVFSAMTLLQALGFFLGQGSGINVSASLGEKHKELAQRYANVAFFTAFFLGILIAVLGLFFSKSIVNLLGSTKTTAEYASSYLKIILMAAPFILGSFVMNNQLRFQGSALYAMIGIMSGGILNIALDPLFIFKFNMGVSGAATATAISQTVSFVILLIGTFKGDNIRISIKKFKPSKEIYLAIFKNGTPSLARQGINSVANISLNFMCKPYGDAAIAAMSVFSRVMFVIMAVVIGIGQGYQPVCGFNNGSKNYKRVYDGFKFTRRICTIITLFASVICFLLAPQIISVFRDDPEVIAIGVKALRFQCFALPFFAYCNIYNMMLQSRRISGKATVLSVSRQGLFYLPLIFILPQIFGITGVEISQACADILSFAFTLILANGEVKKLKSLATSKNKN